MSTLLSSGKLSASPDELAAAYAHAAGGGVCSGGGMTNYNNNMDRTLTLEHLAAFATYSAPHTGEATAGGGGGGAAVVVVVGMAAIGSAGWARQGLATAVRPLDERS